MKNKNEVLEMLSLIGQVTFTLLTPILLLTFIFIKIGEYAGINWLAIIGFVLGTIAGAKGVYTLVKKYIKRQNEGPEKTE